MLPLALAAAAILAHTDRSPELLLPGLTYHAGALRSTSGTPGLELCAGSLVPTTVRISQDSDAALQQVEASQCDSPFLLTGASRLEPGPVKEAASTIDPKDRSLLLSLAGKTWRLSKLPYSDGGVRAVLTTPSGEAVVLFEAPAADSEVRVLWAGDLDGDGKLDVALDAVEGMLAYQLLFLSRAGGEAEPPAVIETVTPGV